MGDLANPLGFRGSIKCLGMVDHAISSLLLGDESITDLVSTRIRPVSLSQTDKRPFVAYQITSTEHMGTLDDPDPDDFTKVIIQIDVYADTYGEARPLSKLIMERLHGYPREDREDDDVVGGTNEAVEIAIINHEATQDLTPEQELGKEKPLFRLSSDYMVMFKEG